MKRLMCNIAGEPGRDANARVNSQGYARPEMGSKHVDTRGAALSPSLHITVIQLFQPPSCLSYFQVCHLRQD